MLTGSRQRPYDIMRSETARGGGLCMQGSLPLLLNAIACIQQGLGLTNLFQPPHVRGSNAIPNTVLMGVPSLQLSWIMIDHYTEEPILIAGGCCGLTALRAMLALIGCQLPQARQAEAFCESYMAREETIIHANDDPRRPLTVALLIRSAALHASDYQCYSEKCGIRSCNRVP